MVLIAGGSGIAPLMSHLRGLRDRQTATPVTLLYSTRRSAACYIAELQTPRHNETIIIRYTDQAPRLTERDITQHLRKNSRVFICGSKSFVDVMRTYVSTKLPPEHIFSESFSL